MEKDAVEIRDMVVLDHANGIILQIPEFTLPHGEICGIYGAWFESANLFLSCISGLCRPNKGRVRIYGSPVDASGSSEYSTGVMPRDGGVFPDLTVGENMSLSLRFSAPEKRSRKDRTNRLTDIARKLALDSWMQTPALRLSGGVRQRLSLACALVHDPQLLVADDPWGRADMESRELIERALRDHCDRGNTLLFASPREQEIEGLASEICLFNRTSLVARGTLDHLRQYLDTRETIIVRVQERAPLLVDRFASLSGVLGCDATEQIVTLQATPESIRLTRLAEHVQSLGLELLDMHIRKPSLSEIYAAVVGEDDTH